LPDFSCYSVTKRENIPKDQQIYQTKLNNCTYTKWPHSTPNGHKIYQTFLSQGLQKKFGIFGLKIYHLATLVMVVPGWNLLSTCTLMDAEELSPTKLAASNSWHTASKTVNQGVNVTITIFGYFISIHDFSKFRQIYFFLEIQCYDRFSAQIEVI
jgi:hypothetical protein